MIPLRDENHSRGFPLVTAAIITANALVFIYQYFIGPMGFEKYVLVYGLKPAGLLNPDSLPAAFKTATPEVLKLFTSMFMHGGFMHIIMNMWVLWIFGDNVEDAMGKLKFAVFYILCGVAAVLAHTVFFPSSKVPLVGASGAIAGVMGAYMLLYPRARVITLFWLFVFIRIIPVPAFIYLGLWFLLQLLYSPTGGPVAYLAHVGGFLAGLLLVFIFAKRGRGFRIIGVK